jgi:starch phosphorylase
LNGWTIQAKDPGGDKVAASEDATRDREDALALYQLLEEEIVPLFYDRDEKGLPRHWIARMKEAIALITPRFSSHRMVREYCDTAYVPLMTGSAASGVVEAVEAQETKPA